MIDRIDTGTQELDKAILLWIGRQRSVDDVMEAIFLLRKYNCWDEENMEPDWDALS